MSELDELRAEAAQLRRDLAAAEAELDAFCGDLDGAAEIEREFGLSPPLATLMALLIERETVGNRAFRSARGLGSGPGPDYIRVAAGRLRNRLEGTGITVISLGRRRYRFDDESRARLIEQGYGHIETPVWARDYRALYQFCCRWRDEDFAAAICRRAAAYDEDRS